jgi:hypothetical protein
VDNGQKSANHYSKSACLLELEAEVDHFCINYSIDYADKFRLAFFEEVSQIQLNPYIYPECRFLPTKSQMYRNIVWGNYLIIYKIRKGVIEVLSLFHTKQKPSKIKIIKKIR